MPANTKIRTGERIGVVIKNESTGKKKVITNKKKGILDIFK